MNINISLFETELVKRARLFCMASHTACGQTRKYTDEPYYHHPIRVANIVGSVTEATPEMIAAALLHDVVEDTQVPLEMVRTVFGDTVAELVENLTDVSRPEMGNRYARRAIDREHTAKASPQAKTIKLADLLDNGETLVDDALAHGNRDFAVAYNVEKLLMLEVLQDGDADLYIRALRLVHHNLDRLEVPRGEMDKLMKKYCNPNRYKHLETA